MRTRPLQTSSFEKLHQKDNIDSVGLLRDEFSQNHACSSRRSIFPDVWKKSTLASPNEDRRKLPHEGMNNSSQRKRKVQFTPLTTVITVIGLNDCHQEDLRWYSEEELSKFKLDAACAVRRILSKRQLHGSRPHGKFASQRRKGFYTHPALQVTDGDDFCSQGTKEFGNLLSGQVKNILIVDPNTTFAGLYIRSFKLMFPHCSVIAINNESDAFDAFMDRRKMKDKDNISGTNILPTYEPNEGQFDIIVVEERLRDANNTRGIDSNETKVSEVTGSDLLRQMTSLVATDKREPIRPDGRLPWNNRTPLFIGTSQFLGQDGQNLVRGGADHIWGKPPPRFDDCFRNGLLNAILRKRGENIVCV